MKLNLTFWLKNAVFPSSPCCSFLRQQLRFDSCNYETGIPKTIFLFQRVKSQLVLELHYCTSVHEETLHFPKETRWKRNNEKVKFKYFPIIVISHRAFVCFNRVSKKCMQIVFLLYWFVASEKDFKTNCTANENW